MQISSSDLRGMAKLTYKIINFFSYSILCKHGTHLILHYYARELFFKLLCYICNYHPKL